MTDNDRLWLQFLIVLVAAIIVFVIFARKKRMTGCLMGLIPIILFTQVAAVVFRASLPSFGDIKEVYGQRTDEERAIDSERRQAFTLIYEYLTLDLLGYTGFALSLWPLLLWAVRRGQLSGTGIPLYFTGVVALLVGAYWVLSLATNFLYTENVGLLYPYLFIYLFFVVFIGGNLNYPIYLFGAWAVIVADAVVLLFVVGYYLLKRRSNSQPAPTRTNPPTARST